MSVNHMLSQALAEQGLDLSAGWVQEHIDPEYYSYLLTRGTHDFVSRDSRTLLITIGDSWTHGSWVHHDIAADWTRATTEAYRQEHCFGQQISKKMGWDFVNISLPAANNQWMALVYKCICATANALPYDRIEIVITFTEYGRELVCRTWRQRVGLHASSGTQLQQITADTVNLAQHLNQAHDIKSLFQALSQQVADVVLSANHPKIGLSLATNYVGPDLYPESLTQQFMNHTWLETLLHRSLPESAWVLGGIVIPWIKSWSETSPVLMQELLAVMDSAEQRQNLIYATGLNRPQGYGHPNRHGHEIWADYLLSNSRLKA